MILRTPERGFLGAPLKTVDTLSTPLAFLGVPFGPAYANDDLTEGLDAPRRIREAYDDYPWTAPESYNFEWGFALADRGELLSDLGDVVGDVRNMEATFEEITGLIRSMIAAGVVPVVQGGLDSVPPLVAAAFDAHAGVNVLHLDSHLDFRDEKDGIRDGYSSPIRRIREMPWVHDIVQLGLRGTGSATVETVRDAEAAGNRILSARQFRRVGVDDFIASLDTARPWLVTLDADALDPAIAPGVAAPEPGGLGYPDVYEILTWIASSGLLAGLVVTEFVPALDQGGRTANTLSRLIAAAVAHFNLVAQQDL